MRKKESLDFCRKTDKAYCCSPELSVKSTLELVMFKISAQLSKRGFALKTGALKANRSLYETGEETGKSAVIDNGVSALAAAMDRNTAAKSGCCT